MPTVDYGSVTLSVDAGRVDVYFPFEHGEVKDALKRMNGRWNPDRRGWTVLTRFAKLDETGIAGAIEEALYAAAPRKWPQAVERFSGFACSTKRYDVKFGAGGLRIALPAGHPCHWTLEHLPGASRKGDIWSVPAKHAKPSEVMPVVERAAREDMKAFIDAVEPYEGRHMKGTIAISPKAADDLALIPGRVVFADYQFVRAADPLVVNMPVHAWPFMVEARDDRPGEGYEHLEEGVSVKLGYLESRHGYKAVRKLQAMPEQERPVRLDGPHVDGKWLCRRG